MRPLELLAPARNADIGIEAVRHGADAVYIGAPQFGARQAAGNSVEDIARLAAFAHQFGAKVYVAVNTILYDGELPAVRRLLARLRDAGADALIVQDMAVRRLLPSDGGRRLPLHASTQMDNRTAEKVRWLAGEGYEQVVLARELGVDDIRAIHSACPGVRLEVFVHGALCVSLSGRCYASEALCRRSANRGECAQVCRMAFDLEDGDGRKLLAGKHLLSLRDLCRLDALEDLADAGASSFKIEGRLKDMAYVKNVTAAYSEALDRLVAKHPDRYCRASRGVVRLRFTPDVRKSFNRGFTDYFLYGRTPDIFSFDTPKAMGAPVGRVARVFTDSIVVDGAAQFANGDGLCFFEQGGKLVGFRVNRVEGSRLFLLDCPHGLRAGTKLFRNHDKRFEDVLARESAERTLPVEVFVDREEGDFLLTVTDGARVASVRKPLAAELARTHQRANLERQLARLGNTPFRLSSLTIGYRKNYFIPSSVVAEWRRELVAQLSAMPLPASGLDAPEQPRADAAAPAPSPFGGKIPYWANVSNQSARQFYEARGATDVEPAFELRHQPGVPVMLCRHCLRHAMGWCHKNGGKPAPAQLFLRLATGRRLRLDFDCRACLMKVVCE